MAADDADAEDADLVAYLDGELHGDDARDVEGQLALDPAARARAEALKKTYDLLDFLPRTEPSPDFASRTLTHLGSAASGSAVRPVATPRPWAKAVGWAVAVLAAGGLGYAGHLLARPHLEAAAPAKRASEQVRLLERLPLLLGADDLDFLHKLDAPDLFGEGDEPDAPAAPVESFTSAELSQLEGLFQRFPPARQEQLRRLDDDLTAAPPAVRDRLLAVAERYAVWLDRLPDGYRKEVLAAPSPADRLEAVRRVRARQWRDGLPAAVRERITGAEEAERERVLADRRRAEAARRQLWAAVRSRWSHLPSDAKPWPFDTDDGAKAVNEYVDRVLRPRLRGFELADLEERRAEATPAAGWAAWWTYGYAVHRAADAHPTLPPAAEGKSMVTTAEDLRAADPKLFRELAAHMTPPGAAKGMAKKPLRELKEVPQHGRWPDFALWVLQEAKDAGLTVNRPLGPCRPADYAPAVARFLSHDLEPKLTQSERAELGKLAGQWPDHPRRLIELAKRHDLPVPGVTLPGRPRQWAETYTDAPGKGKR
jgi:hypothetical protein